MYKKHIIISIIILIILLYFKFYNNNKNIESFKNDILCNNDCKCIYDDNNKTICGRNDKILGILECKGCDDNLYNDLCSECKDNINKEPISFTKNKCQNCILEKDECFKCTNCVWCNDTNSCIKGDIIGPSEGLKCSNWEYYNNDENNFKFPLYDLDKRIREINFQNILKYDDFIKYSDYNKNVINRENQKLAQMNDSHNQILKQRSIDETIYNLSIKQIFNNFSNTIIDILNEITLLFNNINNITFNDFINIFIKEDRLIYIGILSILISISLYIINI